MATRLNQIRAICFISVALLTRASEAQGKELETKVMTRGVYVVGSRMDPEAIGRFGPSDNMPKINHHSLGAPGWISLVALPSDVVPLKGGYRGIRVLLVNRSPLKREAIFEACDSALSLACEALAKDGQWKRIELLPSSICGNSYHRVFLPRGRYWEMRGRMYRGPLKTKLRYKLESSDPIISNEFDGSIHPGQFKEPTRDKNKLGSVVTSLVDLII